MNIFVQLCSCGEDIFGPREGGKARGRWLGYDKCPDCRKKETALIGPDGKGVVNGMKAKPDYSTMSKEQLVKAMSDLIADDLIHMAEFVIRHRVNLWSKEILENIGRIKK